MANPGKRKVNENCFTELSKLPPEDRDIFYIFCKLLGLTINEADRFMESNESRCKIDFEKSYFDALKMWKELIDGACEELKAALEGIGRSHLIGSITPESTSLLPPGKTPMTGKNILDASQYLGSLLSSKVEYEDVCEKLDISKEEASKIWNEYGEDYTRDYLEMLRHWRKTKGAYLEDLEIALRRVVHESSVSFELTPREIIEKIVRGL